MKCKSIKLLALIPVELIDAKNVNSVVILGTTYEKAEVIRLAKLEAMALLNSNGLRFSPYSVNQLNNILNFY